MEPTRYLLLLTVAMETRASVFTGNWAQAWQSVVSIFANIFSAIGTVVYAVINGIITALNAAISMVWNAIVSLVNLFAGVVNAISGGILSFGVDMEAPSIPYLTMDVAMASGGVVTSPTRALIGEGRYDEAVVPLGNSPQMR